MEAVIAGAVKAISSTEGSLKAASSAIETYADAQREPAAAFVQIQEGVCDAISSKLQTAPASGTASCPVCQWLYGWFQSGSVGKQRFVTCFLPVLVWIYLSPPSEAKDVSGVEACLVLIYNDALSRLQGKGDTPFHAPDLSTASPYHAPAGGAVAPPGAPIGPALPGAGAGVGAGGRVGRAEAGRVCGGALLHFLALPVPSAAALRLFCRLATSLALAGSNWAQAYRRSVKGVPLEAFEAAEALGARRPVPLDQPLVQALARGLGTALHRPAPPPALAQVKEVAAAACGALHARCSFDLQPQNMLITQALTDTLR